MRGLVERPEVTKRESLCAGFSRSMSYSVIAAVIEYHRLGSLYAVEMFLIDLEAEKFKSRCRQIRCLVRAPSYFIYSCLLLCPHIVEGAEELSGAFYQDTNLICESSTLMTQSPPKDPHPHTTTLGI